jgi:hypothetical protein
MAGLLPTRTMGGAIRFSTKHDAPLQNTYVKGMLYCFVGGRRYYCSLHWQSWPTINASSGRSRPLFKAHYRLAPGAGQRGVEET